MKVTESLVTTSILPFSVNNEYVHSEKVITVTVYL